MASNPNDSAHATSNAGTDAPEPRSDGGVIYAPWERAFDRVMTPFDEFIHRQTTGGLPLMLTAIVALVLANSPLASTYHHLIELPLGVGVGDLRLEKSLHHWVNDGLMALFFFLVGMELKREFLVGELADLRQAALPLFAAIGGMLVPAAIYTLVNPEGIAARGWGIPMATDIAFAVGALALLAARVPTSLITFLVALAIVDDLGAVMVIAIFYTSDLVVAWLAVAGGLVLLLAALNLLGVRKTLPYLLVAIALWVALLQSGVHATLAGVIGAFSVPTRPRYDPVAFGARLARMFGRYDEARRTDPNVLTNEDLRSVLQGLENGVVAAQTPLQRLEHFWHLPVAFLVVPIFALFNAGIPLDAATLAGALGHPVTMGVVLGLVVGKFVGITGFSWLALRLGIATLPRGTRFSQVASVSLLAGIGCTMSIFISELGFANAPEYLLMAKTGILMASVLSGSLGFALLWYLGRGKATAIEAADAQQAPAGT